MDVTPYLDLKIAPRAVFDTLPSAAAAPRFMLPTGKGDWRAVTWGGFAEQIRNVGLFLSAVGLEPTERAAIFAPNRVEWMSAALGIQAAGGVMVPVYAASTPEQAALRRRAQRREGRLRRHARSGRARPRGLARRSHAVERIVLLDDDLDIAAAGAASARRRSAVPYAEVAAKIQPWSARRRRRRGPRPRGPGRLRADDGRRLARSAGHDALHERHLRQPQGRPAHPPQRGRQRPRLAAVQRARSSRTSAVDLLWLPMSHIFGFGEACLGNTLGFTTYLCEPVPGAREAPRGAARACS